MARWEEYDDSRMDALGRPIDDDVFLQDAEFEARERREAEDQRRRAVSLAAGDVLRAIMETGHGRRWLYDLLVVRCRVFSSGFLGDSRSTDFRLGEQNIGLQIMEEAMAADFNLFTQMLNEERLRLAKS